MAVIPAIKGLDVSIAIDKEPLTEYADDEEVTKDGSSAITKYIEVQNGCKFQIVVKLTSPFTRRKQDFVVDVRLNGKWVFGKYLTSQEFSAKQKFEVFWPAQTCSYEGYQWFNREYTFTETHAEHDKKATRKLGGGNISSMGIISINVYPVKLGNIRPMEKQRVDLVQKHILPKKIVFGKAVDQSIGATHATKLNKIPMVRQTQRISSKDLAVFNFKYRSQASLKALGIVPKTPSPEPPQERDGLDNLSPDQLRDIIRGQLAMNNTKLQVMKQEGDDKHCSKNMSKLNKNCKRYRDEDDDGIEFISQRSKKDHRASDIVNLD